MTFKFGNFTNEDGIPIHSRCLGINDEGRIEIWNAPASDNADDNHVTFTGTFTIDTNSSPMNCNGTFIDENKVCSECECVIKSNWKFCPKCGRKV